MKTKAIFLTLQKTLNPIAVSALLALGVYSVALAVNIEPGVPCPTDEGCTSCGVNFPAGSPRCDNTSFNYTANIGYARVHHAPNFLGHGRSGSLLGQGGRGYYRDFDTQRKEIFDPSNLTNRTM